MSIIALCHGPGYRLTELDRSFLDQWFASHVRTERDRVIVPDFNGGNDAGTWARERGLSVDQRVPRWDRFAAPAVAESVRDKSLARDADVVIWLGTNPKRATVSEACRRRATAGLPRIVEGPRV